MPEVAKCPICGKNPIHFYAENGLLCRLECCDHSISTPFDTYENWNRYAAAMELAEAALCYHDDSQGLSTFEKAAEIYREVFK